MGNEVIKTPITNSVKFRVAYAEYNGMCVKAEIAEELETKLFDLAKEVRETWSNARDAYGQFEAFRILERMVDRIGYGRTENNPTLAKFEERGIKTLTPELDEILGLLAMNTAPLARAYRDAGVEPELPRKVEREQAFILHKLLNLYLVHGEKWREEFQKELSPVIDKAEAAIKARNAAKP